MDNLETLFWNVALFLGLGGLVLSWLACAATLLAAPLVLAARRHLAGAGFASLSLFSPVLAGAWAAAGREPNPDCPVVCLSPWSAFWLALILAVIPAGITSAVTLAIALGSKRPTASQPIPPA